MGFCCILDEYLIQYEIRRKMVVFNQNFNGMHVKLMY